MKAMAEADRWFGLFAVVVGFGTVALSRAFPEAPGPVPGPAIYPQVVAAGLGIVGGWLLIARPPPDRSSSGDRLRPALAQAAVVLVYAAVMPVLGFALASALMLTVAIRLLGYPHWWRAGAIAGAVSLGLHGIFAGLMNVPLPVGWPG